jgi:hypothetical protein
VSAAIKGVPGGVKFDIRALEVANEISRLEIP